MSADDRRPRAVEQVVHAIAEDQPIDESLWRDDDPTLSQLRILYEIGRIHRAALADGQDPAATGGVPPPVSVASWQGGEPNNGPGPHGRDEEALHYFAYVGRAANWNDYPD